MKGAKIVVPSGTYYIKGPIVLASNVFIELQKGATLKFAPEEKYYPVVSITNSPFWCVHLLKSENIICRNLRYDAKLVNNAGIDPECSRYVLIEGVEFNNGDDNVAIKSGRDNDGWNAKMPSENIIIRNCHFKGLHAVVIVTSRYAGEGQDNHHFSTIRNIFIDGLKCNNVKQAALVLQGTEAKPVFNVMFSNVDVAKAKIGLSFENALMSPWVPATSVAK